MVGCARGCSWVILPLTSLEGGFAAMLGAGHGVNSVLHIYNALKVHWFVDSDLPLLSDIDPYSTKQRVHGTDTMLPK